MLSYKYFCNPEIKTLEQNVEMKQPQISFRNEQIYFQNLFKYMKHQNYMRLQRVRNYRLSETHEITGAKPNFRKGFLNGNPVKIKVLEKSNFTQGFHSLTTKSLN